MKIAWGFVLRCVLFAVLLVGVYIESGIFTSALVLLLFISIEIDKALIGRIALGVGMVDELRDKLSALLGAIEASRPKHKAE